VDFAIPANDDATQSIDKIIELVTAEIAKGLAERKESKAKTTVKTAEKAATTKAATTNEATTKENGENTTPVKAESK
jgi:small subunit ribosomal protein S2